MTELIATRGLPGCGKSWWAENDWLPKAPTERAVVNRDDLRSMLHGKTKWSGKREKKITVPARDAVILALLSTGVSVCVADTNLDPKVMAELEAMAEASGADFVVKDFTTVPKDLCIERDLARSRSVGSSVINGMFRRYLAAEWAGAGGVVRDPNLPRAVIFDADGTLCDMNGRNPYDESTCADDLPNEAVVEVAQMYHNHGYNVIVMSGRDEGRGREGTEAWLDKAGIYPRLLLMRAAGDQRKDSIVKRELFFEHVNGRFHVDAVYDDRDQVVELWRGLGLPTFQVDFGDF